jgi:hypothetical protein
MEAKQRERLRKQEALDARILALRKEFEAEDQEARRLAIEEASREQMTLDRQAMAQNRQADSVEERPKRKAPVQRRSHAS